METQANETQELVTVSAGVPAPVAEVYRRAATLTGTDLEGLVQDVLLDNLPYMREMIEIVEQLDAGRPREALATFQRLSDGMQVHAAQELVSLQETLQAQVGVAAERAVERAAARLLERAERLAAQARASLQASEASREGMDSANAGEHKS